LQKSSLNNVLAVTEIYSDYKVSLVKDIRKALGDVKPGDKLVWVRVNGGCFIMKRESKEN
jgi:hypothetical protein